MKTTELIQKLGLGVTLVGDQLIVNAGELSHSITIEYFKRKLDKHTDKQDFPAFVNSTGLSAANKDLIKGVFYSWLDSK